MQSNLRRKTTKFNAIDSFISKVIIKYDEQQNILPLLIKFTQLPVFQI